MPDKRALLTRLLGRLRTEEQREQFSQLEEFLSRALLPDDLQQVKKSRFSFEEADLSRRKTCPQSLGRWSVGSLARKRKRTTAWLSVKCRCAARSCSARIRFGRVGPRRRQASDRLLVWMGGASGLFFPDRKAGRALRARDRGTGTALQTANRFSFHRHRSSRSRPKWLPVITSTPEVLSGSILD